VEGRESGQGVETNPGSWGIGANYDGQFKDRKWHGKGVFTDADGARKVGQWVAGALLAAGANKDAQDRGGSEGGAGGADSEGGGESEGVGDPASGGPMKTPEGCFVSAGSADAAAAAPDGLTLDVGGEENGQGLQDWAGGYDEDYDEDEGHDGGYTGQWRDGTQHGQGVYRYSGGGSYAGQWQQGYRHGQGVRVQGVHGSTYDGAWLRGKRHGKGVEVFPNGDQYDGDYKDGSRHGKGVEICVDGMKYDGEWKDDKMHGKGVETFAVETDAASMAGVQLQRRVEGRPEAREGHGDPR
jgi:hypothetical protein